MQKKKLKVAIITTQFAELGGVENVVREIIRHSGKDIAYTIFTRKKPVNFLRKGKEPKTKTPLKEIPHSQSFKEYITKSKKFFSSIEEEYDIFWFHNWSTVLPIWNMPKIKQKSVLTLHGTSYPLAAAFKKYHLVPFYWTVEKFTSSLPAVVTSVASQHVEKFWPKAKIIWNGVDEEIFYPMGMKKIDSLKKKYKIKDELVLCTVAIFQQRKGTHFLIDALREVNKKTKLLIVGDGEMKAELKKQAKKVMGQTAHEIVFLGPIYDKEKLNEIFNVSDIFVLPTLGEGLPLAMLEAMSTGKAQVVSPVGGVPEILHKAKCGLMPRIKNPKDIADKINKVAEDKKRMGKKARAFVEKHLTWNLIAKKYVCAFQQVFISSRQ